MTACRAPESADELVELLRGRPGAIRLVGSGSRQDRLPDTGAATHLALTALDAIERLDADDLTCSVGAGLTRAALDGALADHGVCLPCAGEGSLGGLFASDPIGATTLGGPAPRSLLLGFEAVLADGTEFRSGARVVKSVAGFDLHKLFVGSRGRLFAATKLHLKLRPMPRGSAWFARTALDADAALAAFVRLRNEPVPPGVLRLERRSDGFALRGRIDGRPAFIRRTLDAHELAEAEPRSEATITAPAGGELLSGGAAPSGIPGLLQQAGAGAFVYHGGGRFELATASPAATDLLLARLPGLAVHACVVSGAPERRGHGTPLDAGERHLTAALKRALDPDDILV